jgi:hypothetical protein
MLKEDTGMALDEQVEVLRAATVAAKNGLLIMEKVAADLLENAQHTGDTAIYTNAVQHQRAAHVAYDIINIEPDVIDTAFNRQQPLVDALRTGWVRWLVNASDEQIERFQEFAAQATGADEGDEPPTSITPPA